MINLQAKLKKDMLKISIVILLTIAITGCVSQNYNDTIKAIQISEFNKGYKDGILVKKRQDSLKGMIEGQVAGQKHWRNKGYDLGYSEGVRRGLDTALKLVKPNKQRYIRHSIDEFSKGQMNGQEQLLKDKDIQALIHSFYQKGRKDCMDSLYEQSILMGENLIRPATNLKAPQMNYKQLVQGFLSKYSFASRVSFSQTLYNIHQRLIDYLGKRLSLTKNQLGDMYQEYEKIHKNLVLKYYLYYINNSKLNNLDESRPYYNYWYFRSMDILVRIVGAGLCSLADTLITYASSNSRYATFTGIEILGKTCETLIQDVLYPMEKRLKDEALILDYDRNITRIETVTKDILRGIIIGYDTDSLRVDTTIVLNKKYKVDIAMSLKTTYDLRLDTKHLKVTVNHRRREFIVHLSNQARVYNVIHQGYKLLDVVNHYRYVKNMERNKDVFPLKYLFTKEVNIPIIGDTFYIIPHQATKILYAYIFNGIYMQNRPTYSEVVGKTRILPPRIVSAIKDLVGKIIEPAVTLPRCCYKVTLNFGGTPYSIYDPLCK